MKTIEEYYNDLLKFEEVEPQELISNWDEGLVSEIEQDFRKSIDCSDLKGKVVSIKEGSSNQSIGNQMADYTAEELNKSLEHFKIEACKGDGYPDKTLVKEDSRCIALEMKATSDWDPRDSNRRVLTSSSKKLRENFTNPIYHLILTTIYQKDTYEITAIRLDFIQPATQVNIRLEASVNHKILEDGDHKSIIF